ncbi:hypothetical protein CN210_33110 [Sinorhizobium meliloti]|nr:hypothetical protein Sinme_6408 [Sinorhizobium meliloti AK83]RVG94698.1 hypothetical protein CN210_33110 [Sinorhizobium meliloti]SEJ82833.1 hypothetical protein SAMN04244575_06442 [Sinorhizobium meliloti]
MTTAPPPAHYGAVEGALASGFATAELHHLWGHDPTSWHRAVDALSQRRLRKASRTYVPCPVLLYFEDVLISEIVALILWRSLSGPSRS